MPKIDEQKMCFEYHFVSLSTASEMFQPLQNDNDILGYEMDVD